MGLCRDPSNSPATPVMNSGTIGHGVETWSSSRPGIRPPSAVLRTYKHTSDTTARRPLSFLTPGPTVSRVRLLLQGLLFRARDGDDWRRIPLLFSDEATGRSNAVTTLSSIARTNVPPVVLCQRRCLMAAQEPHRPVMEVRVLFNTGWRALNAASATSGNSTAGATSQLPRQKLFIPRLFKNAIYRHSRKR